MVVRYEDMCDSPNEVIENMIGHTNIDPESFIDVKEHYCSTLRKPTYYKTSYTKEEQERIISTTEDVATNFGYDF